MSKITETKRAGVHTPVLPLSTPGKKKIPHTEIF
jgi:hypothetical protein